MWKILESTMPVSEKDLSGLAADGWDLRMCVPHDGKLYWYLFKPN